MESAIATALDQFISAGPPARRRKPLRETGENVRSSSSRSQGRSQSRSADAPADAPPLVGLRGLALRGSSPPAHPSAQFFSSQTATTQRPKHVESAPQRRQSSHLDLKPHRFVPEHVLQTEHVVSSGQGCRAALCTSPTTFDHDHSAWTTPRGQDVFVVLRLLQKPTVTQTQSSGLLAQPTGVTEEHVANVRITMVTDTSSTETLFCKTVTVLTSHHPRRGFVRILKASNVAAVSCSSNEAAVMLTVPGTLVADYLRVEAVNGDPQSMTRVHLFAVSQDATSTTRIVPAARRDDDEGSEDHDASSGAASDHEDATTKSLIAAPPFEEDRTVRAANETRSRIEFTQGAHPDHPLPAPAGPSSPSDKKRSDPTHQTASGTEAQQHPATPSTGAAHQRLSEDRRLALREMIMNYTKQRVLADTAHTSSSTAAESAIATRGDSQSSEVLHRTDQRSAPSQSSVVVGKTHPAPPTCSTTDLDLTTAACSAASAAYRATTMSVTTIAALTEVSARTWMRCSNLVRVSLLVAFHRDDSECSKLMSTSLPELLIDGILIKQVGSSRNWILWRCDARQSMLLICRTNTLEPLVTFLSHNQADSMGCALRFVFDDCGAIWRTTSVLAAWAARSSFMLYLRVPHASLTHARHDFKSFAQLVSLSPSWRGMQFSQAHHPSCETFALHVRTHTRHRVAWISGQNPDSPRVVFCTDHPLSLPWPVQGTVVTTRSMNPQRGASAGDDNAYFSDVFSRLGRDVPTPQFVPCHTDVDGAMLTALAAAKKMQWDIVGIHVLPERTQDAALFGVAHSTTSPLMLSEEVVDGWMDAAALWHGPFPNLVVVTLPTLAAASPAALAMFVDVSLHPPPYLLH